MINKISPLCHLAMIQGRLILFSTLSIVQMQVLDASVVRMGSGKMVTAMTEEGK